MGRVGRTLADALNEFGIAYSAVERDDKRLREAVADGYQVAYGDFADPRIWEPIALQGRTITVLTAPRYEVSRELSPIAAARFPNLKRVAVVRDPQEAERFRSLGALPVIDRSVPSGLDLAVFVLGELGIDPDRVATWMRQQQDRALSREVAAA